MYLEIRAYLAPEYIGAAPASLVGNAHHHLAKPPGGSSRFSAREGAPAELCCAQACRGLRASFGSSSPRQSPWLEGCLDFWDGFDKLWGRRPCGKCLELSQIGSISDPQDQESIQRGLLKEPFIWRSSQELGRGPRLTGLFRSQPEDA